MSLTDLSTLLQETAEQIYVATEALAEDPSGFSALTNLRSLEKRQAVLQEQFDEVAGAQQVEVLRYRMAGKPGEPPVKALSELVTTFQRSFSVVYDALVTKSTKTRARLGGESIRDSTLSFAYAFPGSVGFALTLPRELKLLDTPHDDTVQAIQEISRVTTSDEIRDFAKRYGIASVRSLFQWFDTIAKTDLDCEIEWKGPNKRDAFMVQVPDARAIRDLIERTAEVDTLDRHYWGTLIAYDSDRRTFRFAIADRKAIRGTVAEGITEKLRVPDRYEATIRVRTTSRYSTEEKEEHFELLEIRSSTGPEA